MRRKYAGKEKSIKIFDRQEVRAVWDKEKEKWWFSVVDVVAILTESENPRHYWTVLKQRLKDEGNETVTNCERLKFQAADGKMRLTDVADTEQLLRLIQSIPSKKAEPFKMWLAMVGNERIDETADPELSINRAIQNYRRMGHSEDWIDQRIKTVEIRKALTDEWDKSGIREGKEYAILTNLMNRTWSGMTISEHKELKGLKKESLRDNMTNTESVLNMLAEVAATDISAVRRPKGFDEAADVAEEGANIARTAREQLEKSTGRPAVSHTNAKVRKERVLKIGKDSE